jgi:hypothetical protein
MNIALTVKSYTMMHALNLQSTLSAAAAAAAAAYLHLHQAKDLQ